MGKTYRIAVIPGDGIGKETVPEGLRVLDAAATRFGFSLKLRPLRLVLRDLQADRRDDAGGRAGPAAQVPSVFLGAVGWPGVPDHVSLWGLLIPIRRGFDQYVNVRPCRLMPGVRDPAGRAHRGGHRLLRRAREHRGRILQRRRPACSRAPTASSSCQLTVMTRTGVDRILKYAFELAMTRPRKKRDLGDQVERHHLHHAVLGRAVRG